MRSSTFRIPLLAAALVLLPGCGEDEEVIRVPTQGQAVRRELTSGGLTRSYQVWIPNSVSRGERVPLVLAFHGAGSRGSDMRAYAGLDAMAGPLEMLVVYPEAAAGDWADGCDCTTAERDGVDDLQFLRDLLEHVAGEFSYDPARVYATGFSQGGLFAEYAACELPDLIAAVAAVAASTSAHLTQMCAPGGPIPIVLMHGTGDPIFPPSGTTSGSRRVLPIQDAVDFWLGLNGCAAEPTETVTVDPQPDGTRLLRRAWTDCEGGSEVMYFEIQGGGHTWPNPFTNFPASSGRTSKDFEAAVDIGLFFDRH